MAKAKKEVAYFIPEEMQKIRDEGGVACIASGILNNYYFRWTKVDKKDQIEIDKYIEDGKELKDIVTTYANNFEELWNTIK